LGGPSPLGSTYNWIGYDLGSDSLVRPEQSVVGSHSKVGYCRNALKERSDKELSTGLKECVDASGQRKPPQTTGAAGDGRQ
jgi:hypothetical protein